MAVVGAGAGERLQGTSRCLLLPGHTPQPFLAFESASAGNPGLVLRWDRGRGPGVSRALTSLPSTQGDACRVQAIIGVRQSRAPDHTLHRTPQTL